MDDLVAAAVYFSVSLALSPITAMGCFLWLVGAVSHGRKAGVSVTAQGPLATRVWLHAHGARHDEVALRLMRVLPGVPSMVVRMVSDPVAIAHRISGYVPEPFRYPYPGEPPLTHQLEARTTFFDDVLSRFAHSAKQLVILGAGFDTRCYNLPREAQLRCFEIDAPKTQALKREMLARVGIDASAVSFVSADFEKDDWFDRLCEAGFSQRAPAIFLWEGVTMYLDRASVESTLRKIAGTAKGSVVAFDFMSSELLQTRDLLMRYVRFATQIADEPMTFGIDSTPPLRDRVHELLESCGLTLAEGHWLGETPDGKRAWGGFATGVVPSASNRSAVP